MHNATKLLPVLLISSALSGCSLASGYFADEIGNKHQAQSSQYWGASSSCDNPQQTVCREGYVPAQSQATNYPAYSAATTGATQYYSQASSYPAYNTAATTPTQQSYQSYSAQPAYQQPAYQAQQGYSQQSYTPQGYSQHEYGATTPYFNAQSGHSTGLRKSYTYGTLGATLYDVESSLYGAQARLGWQSKGIFGAEVEGSLGVTDKGITDASGALPIDIETGVGTQLAAFGVARYPVSKKIDFLTRVGYHNTKFNVDLDDGTNVTEDDFSTDGFAYGLGAEYAFDSKTSVRADFTRYDYDGPDADAISLAVARKF